MSGNSFSFFFGGSYPRPKGRELATAYLSLIVNICLSNPVSISVSDVDTGYAPYIALYTGIAPVRGCAQGLLPSGGREGGGFTSYITTYHLFLP